MSYERMEKRAAELEAEVAKRLAVAEATDAEEDKLHGADKTGGAAGLGRRQEAVC
jgi:hypothetical protein